MKQQLRTFHADESAATAIEHGQHNPVGSSLMRYIHSLGRTERETRKAHLSRLLHELSRRTNQLHCTINPLYREHSRLEKLVGPRGVWVHLQQYQFNILSSVGLEPHHSLLDIGCGPLTVGLRLISYLEAGNYVGLDMRMQPLTEAYKLIAKNSLAHKNPTLINSSTFGKEELADRRFDFVWVSQLSYHLDDSQTVRLFEQARAMMKPTSIFLLDIIDPEIEIFPGAQCNGFSYYVRPYEFYEAMANDFSFAIQRRGIVRDYGYPEAINLKSNLVLEFRARSKFPATAAA